MRAFWAIVIILLIAGGAAAFLATPSSGPGSPSAPIAPTEAPKPAPAASDTPPAPPPPVIDQATVNDIIGKAAGGDADGHAEIAKAAAEGTPFELPTTETYPLSKLIPAKAVKTGKTIVIDGVYRVTGAGTKDDPFVVPFDLLMSARDSYNPRKGLTKMPQRVAFLHQKYVRLTGYTAFPISSSDPHEMLVMFNAWDGCCIGVPPSEYDAVETHLGTPASGDDKFISFGTVTGLFKVDPYIDNGWLLGLYMMDGATLTDGKTDPSSPKAALQHQAK